MKLYRIILPTAFMLFITFCGHLEAQNQTAATGLQANEQEALLNNNVIESKTFWFPTIDKTGIYYPGYPGRVGIGTANPNEKFLLHVVGIVGVNELVINDQYSLPTERGGKNEFLNGLGEWEIISSSVGGESIWNLDPLTKHIYYNEGRVGVGTATPEADLHVQGNMKLGSNIGNVGSNAFAGGDGSTASGTNSFAFGENVKATMRAAFAGGKDSEANSIGAVALGQKAIAGRTVSIAIGNYVEANAGNAIVFGGGSIPDKLVNSVSSSLMIGFNSTVPTFFVSSSAGVGTTGKIGIGNMTDPQDKLHIKADANETATIRLEPTATVDSFRFAQLYLGNHRIRAGNNDNMVFSTPATNRHFVFENGNVGIGVSSPTKKLVVAGDIDFSGDLYSNGQLFIGSNWTVNGENIYRSTGNVGIGTNDPQAALDVQGNSKFRGNLYVEEVIVEEAANWPDYVFEANYQLMDLNELKSFITINKHLPDMPKADENGKVNQVKLAEMNALLLKKIEELTLYMLEQEERIREIEKSVK